MRPIGQIQNLKIDLTRCSYKILVTILIMEEGKEVYSMLLGRPWLKQTKATHNWGNNALIITSRNKEITFITIKKIKPKPISTTKALR
jgi:hypothetical protein